MCERFERLNMVTKKTKAVTKPPARTKNEKAEEERHHRFAKRTISPAVAAWRIISAAEQETGIAERIDFKILLDELHEQAAAVNRGDLTQAEAMLMNQATSLQTLYARLVERAMDQSLMPNFEGLMRIALKAQNQSRMTIETLAAIKNPPVVFAKQANIAHGHQQVNNGTPSPAHAEKTINQPNELLEVQHGERMDTGTTCKAIRKDKAMAAVDKINGRTDTRRKG